MKNNNVFQRRFEELIMDSDGLVKITLEVMVAYQLGLPEEKIPTSDDFIRIDKWAAGLDENINSLADLKEMLIADLGIKTILSVSTADYMDMPKVKDYRGLVYHIHRLEKKHTPKTLNIMIPFLGEKKKIVEHIDYNNFKAIVRTTVTYNLGQLVTEFEKDSTINPRYESFVWKFMDYCIANTDSDGTIPVLFDIEKIYGDLGLTKGGPQKKKIDYALKYLTNTKAHFQQQLPIKNTQGDKFSMVTGHADYFLQSVYIERTDAAGRKFKASKPLYMVPSFIRFLISGKNSYSIYRESEYFKLPDDEYVFIMYLQGKMRMGGILNNPGAELAAGIVPLLIAANKTLNKHIKKNIVWLSATLEKFEKIGVFESYHIIDSKTKKELPLTWHEKNIIRLTVSIDGKPEPNIKELKRVIYYFKPTKKFISNHRIMAGYKQFNLFEKV